MLEEESLLREWYRPHNERLFRLLGSDLGWNAVTLAAETVLLAGDTAMSGQRHVDTPSQRTVVGVEESGVAHVVKPHATSPVLTFSPLYTCAGIYVSRASVDKHAVVEPLGGHAAGVRDIDGSRISPQDKHASIYANHGTAAIREGRPTPRVDAFRGAFAEAKAEFMIERDTNTSPDMDLGNVSLWSDGEGVAPASDSADCLELWVRRIATYAGYPGPRAMLRQRGYFWIQTFLTDGAPQPRSYPISLLSHLCWWTIIFGIYLAHTIFHRVARTMFLKIRFLGE